MSTQTAFSSNDDVITKKIDNVENVLLDDMEDYFEIQRCIDFVINNGYETLALQFPDELLNYAYNVYESIEKGVTEEILGFKIYVLADTSYGSCCVDEVAASHVDADSIIHFGPTCLSATENIPVLHVFGKSYMDVHNFQEKMNEVFCDKSKVLLFYDVRYNHCIEKISEELPRIKAEVEITKIRCCSLKSQKMEGEVGCDKDENSTNEGRDEINDSNENKNDVKHDKDANGVSEMVASDEMNSEKSLFGRCFMLAHNISQYDIVYIGSESVTLTNLILTYNRHKVYSYNPITKEMRVENMKVNKSLMKRFYLIEKARDSNIIGIVMGTLGVARYKEMVTRLKQVLKHASKKFYTFIIGKMNVAKLANFMEIDIFVLIACPENTLIDSKEFYKPVVTPYEMEIACLETREWSGEYVVDFSQLLPGSSHHVDIDDGRVASEAQYSFITGQMRSNCKVVEDEHESSTDLTIRNKETHLIQYTAGEYLTSRSWKGLEINCKQSKVENVVEGRAGIAMGYENEPGE